MAILRAAVDGPEVRTTPARRRAAASGGVIDPERPAALILALQRTAGNTAVVQTLNRHRHPGALGPLVVQRTHYGTNQAGWNPAGNSGLLALLNVQIGAGAQRWPYDMARWTVALGAVNFASRAAAVAAEQAWLAAHAVPATSLATAVHPRVRGVHGANVVTDAVYRTAQGFWPFIVRLTSSYQTAGGPVNRAVEVQFARDKYGYIIRIDDGAAAYTMAAQGAVPGPGQYASQHMVDTTRDLLAASTRLGDETDADDQTKIIAEGARWRAVAQLAAAGQLFDDSAFYPGAAGRRLGLAAERRRTRHRVLPPVDPMELLQQGLGHHQHNPANRALQQRVAGADAEVRRPDRGRAQPRGLSCGCATPIRSIATADLTASARPA